METDLGVSADVFLHLPGLPWMRSLAVLLQDKLQRWPHVGPLQSGVAWTIARLCWPISRFFLARLTTAWVTSSPACLRVYRAPALNCLWYHRTPSINGCTVVKWPPGRNGKKRPGFWHGTPPAFFPSVSFWGFSPLLFPVALGSGAHGGSYDSSLRWRQTWNEETVRQFSLCRHLMI